MSEIHGHGYGDQHQWIKLFTNQVGSNGIKSTTWICENCAQIFIHYYDSIPDIFEAMKKEHIREICNPDPPPFYCTKIWVYSVGLIFSVLIFVLFVHPTIVSLLFYILGFLFGYLGYRIYEQFQK